MTATPRDQRLRLMQLIFAGAAGIAMLLFVDAARPDITAAMSGRLRVAATAFDSPLPQSPSTTGAGLPADDTDDQQAQLQEQLAQQQMQQSQQQAEQQNEAALQQAEQDMQQGQLTEQQANNP